MSRQVTRTRSGGGLDAAQETIRTCNRLYWYGAREAARISAQHAASLFGLSHETAQWLATAPLEEVLDLAEAPVVTFRVELPSAVAERADAPRSLKHMHLALRAADTRS